MKQYPSPPPAACVPAALLLAWRRLRRILFHDKAGDIVFRAALAPFALAAALLAIPADEARAQDNYPAHSHPGFEVNHLHSHWRLAEAVKNAHWSTINHLLYSHNVNPDATHSGKPALHIAIENGHAAVASVLIAAGANVHRKEYDALTPLHYAANYGPLAIVAALITLGADVNAKTARFAETPLLYAAAGPKTYREYYAAGGRVAAMLTLIAAGADMNVKDSRGFMLLHYAAIRGNVAGVATLIALGATVNAKTNDGQTPLIRSYDLSASVFRSPDTAAAASVLIAAGGHWGEACANGNIVNPAGPSPPCICQSPNVRISENCVAASAESCGGLTPPAFYDSAAGECVAFVECAAPAVLNVGANLCDCPAPNVGADGADAPGDCAAPSAQVCGGLTPPAFYAATLSACVAVAECAAPAVLNAGANRCDCPAPNVGANGADAPGDCVAASAESCGGLTPPQFYAATLSACVAVAECASPSVLNAGANRCDCPAPNVGANGADAPGDCVAASAESCGGLTPPQFYAATLSACVAVAECASPSVLNAGANRCDCPAPNVGTDGADAPGDCVAASAESCGGLTPPAFYDSAAAECAPFADCQAAATLNRVANQCECAGAAVLDGAGTGCLCESPNLGTPGDCAAPSVESCGGLTPAKFYDAPAGECVAVAECAAPAVLNAGANWCDCPAPNVGTDGADAPGDCVAASAESCGGLTPPAFYDSAAGECVPFADCQAAATLNRVANQCECAGAAVLDGTGLGCECLAPNLDFGGGDCRPPTAANCAEHYDPPRFFDPTAGKCGARLYPCHDSAVVKADNSGCECPAGTFAHGDPSGGNEWDDCVRNYRYGRCLQRGVWSKRITLSAVCHADHAPIQHNIDDWLSAVFANNPTLVAHFISDHKQDPDGGNFELHSAARNGYYSVAKALIEGGADIERKRSNNTPLHEAVKNGRGPLITLLLQRGADADAAGGGNNTPLHLAARRPDTAENVALILFLLDKGATPNPRNDSGWRPLDLAYDGGNAATWQARRGIMAALIEGGATWSDECTGGTIPNENVRPLSGVADCVCPLHLSERDSRGRCECPAHSHAQVNGRCLPKDSAQVEAEILKMETELLRLRAALVSLNARLSTAAEMPREMVEEIAEQAGDTAQEIKRRRDNFLALARADLAGAPPPPVAMSDTAAECRMLGGEVQIHSATGIRICSGIDGNDTFCLVDSGDAYPCRGLFRHVRTCNDDYNRRALNPFFCGARCGAQKAVGKDCAAP